MDQFVQSQLNPAILRALTEEGYQTPTDIQKAAIPALLEGKDLLGTAKTGTGKTAAFALPILHLLHQRAAGQSRVLRALILTPTRELALQIETSLRTYGRHLPLRTAVIMGGVPAGSQIKALRNHPDILVATPGRLLDLMSQGHVRLNRIEMFVLDEADRMLDMGFIHDVRSVVSQLPKTRQTMFFSATMSKEIADLAGSMLTNPIRVAVAPVASVADNITQKVLFVDQTNKRELLTRILRETASRRVLVFTRTKHRANRLMQQITNNGISAEVIHSNKSQNARQKALADFDSGRVKVLVATDIVSRGIDVEGISHVINYELPDDPESYVHRIGRTARAGANGTALSFCDMEEVPLLQSIERLTKSPLIALEDHPFHATHIAAMHKKNDRPVPSSIPNKPQPRNRRSRPRNGSRRQPAYA